MIIVLYFKNNIYPFRLYHRFLIYMIFCLFFITPALASQSPNTSSRPFDGEILKFNMKFNGFSTANSIFHTELSDSLFLKLNWDIRSKTVYKLFFYVNNQYFTFVDIKSWLPVKQFKKINQKNITQSFETVFDRENLIAKTDNGLQWPIKKNCLDLLSMLYHIRTRELAPGDSLCYILDIESHIWKITGIVHEGDKIEGSYQELKTLQIDFSFTPELPVIKRKWKTDLLTNRISRPNTKLTICLGPPPESLPVFLKFETTETSVEMLLDKYSLKK